MKTISVFLIGCLLTSSAVQTLECTRCSVPQTLSQKQSLCLSNSAASLTTVRNSSLKRWKKSLLSLHGRSLLGYHGDDTDNTC